MRTIKFRAWQEGDDIIGGKMFSPAFPSWNGSIEIRDGDYTVEPHFLSIYGEEQRGILMQFTGLLDRSGKEIYEGDIVYVFSYREVKVYYIVYSRASFVLKENNPNSDIRISLQDEYEMEIIGNVFENPTLLSDSTPGK